MNKSWVIIIISIVVLIIMFFATTLFGLMLAIAMIIAMSYLISNNTPIRIVGGVDLNLDGLKPLFRIVRTFCYICLGFILINFWVNRHVDSIDITANKIGSSETGQVHEKYGFRVYTIPEESVLLRFTGTFDNHDIWEQNGDNQKDPIQVRETVKVGKEVYGKMQIGKYDVWTVNQTSTKVRIYYVHAHYLENFYLWWFQLFSEEPRPLG